tara:strand:+ start:490 stop:1482 length:993 start_codon:yes stop_codon:yes gene_type:complete
MELPVQDKEEVLEYFLKKRASRKYKTNEQYSLRLTKLARSMGHENLKFLVEDVDKVFEHLEDKPVTTQANILTAIIDFLLIQNDHAEELKRYKERKQTNQEKYYQQNEKGELIGAQKDNFVPLEELMKYYHTIEEEVKNKNYETSDSGVAREYLNLRILLRLYLMYPSRNEYSNLELIQYKDFKKIKYLMKNYLVVKSGSNPFLSISEYKTAVKHKTKTTEIKDPTLKKLIEFHKKKFGFGNMFFTQGGRKYENIDLSKLLTKYSKIYLKKSISTTLMYKIIIQSVGQEYHTALESDDHKKIEELRKILKEHARIRGHTTQTQKTIYIKQ